MKTSTEEESLKSALIDVLSRDKIDGDELLALSNALTESDPNAVRFSVDASLISRLGRELVARQETAVAELVKNAYDADARKVTLVFSEADAPGGRLELTDDGLGMTRDQLVNGFMRLASGQKVDEPISPRYKRQRAGRKGIGRFAVQRLGDRLTITTQTKGSPVALRVTIDWNKFAAGQDLASISSRITEIPKQKAEGTTLLIDGLREAWNEVAIKKVYKYVSDLIQPFPLSEKGEARIDPGFKIDLLREVAGEFELVADETTEIFQHALAEIEGYVDNKGKGFWSITSDRLELAEVGKSIMDSRENRELAFNSLQNIRLKAYYFIYNGSGANFLPRSANKMIRDLAQERGGIRVYRNGFRVSPYGDSDNDWLGLDELARRRSFLPAIGNINFFGFIEIVDIGGDYFEETSSREGLLENSAFQELQDFTHRVLKAAATEVAEARGKKITASQKDYKTDPSAVITKAIKSVDRLAKELVGAGQSGEAKQLKGVSKQLKMAAAIQSDVLEELSMLRVLASLGLTIGEFTHEVQQTLGAASLSAKHILEATSPDSEQREIAHDLLVNIQRFQAYAVYFQKSVSDNINRELEPQDAAKVAKNFVNTVQLAAKSVGIYVEQPEVVGTDLITCPMHASEWSSVLFNLYTNARKAITRARSDGKIFIRVGKEGKKVYLEFADNGDGVPKENEERVFNAFFTTTGTTGRYATDEEEIQGTGLGLKIVDDIATSYNGDVSLVAPQKGYATCFRIEFPEATPKELEAYGY